MLLLKITSLRAPIATQLRTMVCHQIVTDLNLLITAHKDRSHPLQPRHRHHKVVAELYILNINPCTLKINRTRLKIINPINPTLLGPGRRSSLSKIVKTIDPRSNIRSSSHTTLPPSLVVFSISSLYIEHQLVFCAHLHQTIAKPES